MSKYSEEFDVFLPFQEAEFAVKEAVANCGWGVKEQEPGRIVPRIGVGLTRNPSKIEVLMAGDAQGPTTISLNGKIAGMGPLQKRHIAAEVGKLRNAIDVSVRRAEAAR
ncbi:MAG TPA: hypothetical protein VNL97_08550 [Solirubrobacterales bacterium]|nr:hypothetical protein [Solirubrobacterales bacterium]